MIAISKYAFLSVLVDLWNIIAKKENSVIFKILLLLCHDI